MYSKKYQTLQEAYLNVYEGRGSRGGTSADSEEFARKIAKRAKKNPQNIDRYWSGVLRLAGRAPSGSSVIDNAKREFIKKEDVDLYDIILSHLLDEGYAETPEAAEVIMVNMSEDWRESVIEEILDEAAVDWEMSSSDMEKARNERKFGKQSFNQSGQTQLRRELHRSKRGVKKKDERRWNGEK